MELVYYDDESTSDRVQQLYTKLITEDKVDFLISPYSSGLTAAAAQVTESYGKIMIATGAASDSIFKKGYTRVYQVYTPASKYMAGAIDMLQQVDPGIKKLAFLFENSKFAKSVATAVKAYAESKGYEIVYEEYYPSGATEFTTYIAQIAQSGAEALLGGGHFQDGQSLAQQLYQQKPPLKAVFILVAPTVPEFADIGDAAVGFMGPSQWEAIAPYSPDQAKTLGLEWYGPTIDEFVNAYKAEYGKEPGYHAAGGYVAGLVLQYALEKAGTTNPDKVKDVLDNMHILTFWGEIQFSSRAEDHGLQVAHERILIQWQKVGGKLERVVVWPAKFAKAQALYPIWG